MMTLARRVANAVRRRREALRRPRMGELAAPDAAERWRSYPADGLTPQRLVAILRAADDGDPAEQLALYEQMEEKDPHLYCVANTRRLAVTGLPWRIVSAAQVDPEGRFDRGLADAAAAHCRETLGGIERFDESLRHLALAIGRNAAAVELVWEADAGGLRLADLAPIDFARLTTDASGAIRIRTADAPRDGITAAAGKFIVHTPHAASGHVTRGGLLRVSALAFLGKQFAIKDWLIFAEVFGMPVRIARYEPQATPQEKRELLDMLRRLGADAAGVFSKAVDLEIKQTRQPGDVNPYESLCHFFNRELSKAWLGQTLTTDTARAIANLSAAEVHDRVRRDLRDDDLRQEAHTLRRDLLAVLTRFALGPAAEPPYFVRLADQPRDPAALGRALAIAVNELGARVPAEWAHGALGIPQATAGELALPGRAPGAAARDGGPD